MQAETVSYAWSNNSKFSQGKNYKKGENDKGKKLSSPIKLSWSVILILYWFSYLSCALIQAKYNFMTQEKNIKLLLLNFKRNIT